MVRSTSIALLVLTIWPVSASWAQDATAEAAIRTIVAEQVVAWNAGDGKRYAGHLAPDASFTNLFGMVRNFTGYPTPVKCVRINAA